MSKEYAADFKIFVKSLRSQALKLLLNVGSVRVQVRSNWGRLRDVTATLRLILSNNHQEYQVHSILFDKSQ